MAQQLTYQQIEKIGNTLVYLAEQVGELSKTKILKLLFLLEESSVKTFGVPFLGVDFELWKFGPVIQDVYVDLSEEKPELFSRFIRKAPYNDKLYEAATTFNDDEFSDNDIYLLEKIVAFARHKTAVDLVDYTHNRNSLWRKSAIKYGIFEDLEKGAVNTTQYTIDFGLVFENEPELQAYYQEAVENRQFINALKS